jgi:hypothetical protein
MRFGRVKLVLLFVCLAAVSFGQVGSFAGIWGLNPGALAAYDAAYWPAQPPEVQALQNMAIGQRPAAAEALAVSGYVIDVPIMVQDADPYVTMMWRAAAGYTWVPSALQGSVCAPGVNNPATASNPPYCPYNPASPPAGSIAVTTAPLAPFYPVAPAPAAPAQDPVGSDTGAQFTATIGGVSMALEAYNDATGTIYTEGYLYTGDTRGTFYFHLVGPSLMAARYGVWLLEK